jgi:hypothetical protein
VAVLALLVVLAAPEGRRVTRPSPLSIAAAATARGVVHVHTTRSDGSGTVDEVAAAAARAGLQFLVVTDHGDGTRVPLAPAYRAGVLVIDGVEISTTHGHYVAIGLGTAPYRLAGDAADVVDDVRRLGGFGFAAHPDSPRDALAWRAWDAPIDGLEWFNLDSEWRDDPAVLLARAVAFYPFRPVPSIASLIGDGAGLLPRWAEIAATRRLAGIAAVDAHARLGTEGGFDDAWVNLRLPSYERLFATAQVTVELDAPLSGDAGGDAAAVQQALRDGRSFSTVSARAEAGRVAMAAARGAARARMGQFLGGDAPPVVTVEADAPAGAVIRIVCDGRTVTQTPAGATLARTLQPGEMGRACQAVVGWPGRSPDRFVTWAVTNPIYWRASDPAATPPAYVAARSEVFAGRRSAWTIEHSPGSIAHIADVAADPVPDLAPGAAAPAERFAFGFALAPGARAGQYAALATSDIGALGWARWLKLEVRVGAPMRVSLQMREPVPGGGRRWQRSLALDPRQSTYVVPLAGFAPVADAAGPAPVTRVRSFLLVVDTVNTPPGRRGEIVIHELRAEAP